MHPHHHFTNLVASPISQHHKKPRGPSQNKVVTHYIMNGGGGGGGGGCVQDVVGLIDLFFP